MGDRVVQTDMQDAAAPKQLVEACTSSTRIMFASSGTVFGGVEENAKWRGLTEEDTPCPKLPYAETKVAMERFLAERIVRRRWG